MSRIGALVVAVALAVTLPSATGCSGGTAGPPTTFGVNVTIDATSIPTATRKQITGGVLTVEGPITPRLMRPLELAGAIQSGEVRFHFTPTVTPGATSGVLTLTVVATGANGDTLAVGVSPPVTWIAGQAVPTMITLSGPSNNDGGVGGQGGVQGPGGQGGVQGPGGQGGAAGVSGTAGGLGGHGGSPSVGGAGGTAKGGAPGTGGVGGANAGGAGVGGTSVGGAGGVSPVGTGGTATGGTAPDAGVDASGCAACTAEQYCLAGACKTKHPAGRAPAGGCTDDNQCQTSYCALKDGICCDSGCAGQCESCNVDGKCTVNANGQAPIASHGGPCAGAGTECGGYCDGSHIDCVYPTKDCGTAQCSCTLTVVSSCKETPVGKCGGGSCQRSPRSCNYDCNAGYTACLTSCVISTNAGCPSGRTCTSMACFEPTTGVSKACCL